MKNRGRFFRTGKFPKGRCAEARQERDAGGASAKAAARDRVRKDRTRTAGRLSGGRSARSREDFYETKHI